MRWVQAWLDPLFMRLQGGHLLRDSQQTVLAAGLDIEMLAPVARGDGAALGRDQTRPRSGLIGSVSRP